MDKTKEYFSRELKDIKRKVDLMLEVAARDKREDSRQRFDELRTLLVECFEKVDSEDTKARNNHLHDLYNDINIHSQVIPLRKEVK